MSLTKDELNNLGTKVIGAAIEVHKELGAGLLESVYESCLIEELSQLGIKTKSQAELPIFYKKKQLKKTYRIDLLVEDEIIIELKCVDVLLPVHEVQLVTYMKLANKKLGYLMNFNVSHLKYGIKRKVNGL